MLTRLRVRNFKMLEELDIELGDRVVFIGPNNSGKTTAMQALALWWAGLRAWRDRIARRGNGRQRGVALTRAELTAVPVPDTRALWRNLRIRSSRMVDGKQHNENIRIEIIVSGETAGQPWECGLEFDYANDQTFYCRPLRLSGESGNQRMEIPAEAADMPIWLLPPMSGLLGAELRIDEGAINVRIGEGRTAEILRNLCYRLYQANVDRWHEVVDHLGALFGVTLQNPRYITDRGEIAMSYREGDVELDLSAAGRGLQQTLLLLTYMYTRPRSVLMLDEPDAHLEILRQREAYDLIADTTSKLGSQVVAASHSEVLLNEAAGRDSVIAFIGNPHPIDDRGAQVAKSLSQIGWDQYAQASQKRWVLYLEGTTDLALLRAFADRLSHTRAQVALQRPLVHYIGNVVSKAQTHFYGLREAISDLKAVALFDRIGDMAPMFPDASVLMWSRREIENFICSPAGLEAYARETAAADQFPPDTPLGWQQADERVAAMRQVLDEFGVPLDRLMTDQSLSRNIKASEDVLDRIFRDYYANLGLYNRMAKGNFYELVQYIPIDDLDIEIAEKLDAIADVAESATPAGG